MHRLFTVPEHHVQRYDEQKTAKNSSQQIAMNSRREGRTDRSADKETEGQQASDDEVNVASAVIADGGKQTDRW